MSKLPAGITQIKSGQFAGWYATRPYDRTLKKKGPQQKFPTLAEAVAYKEKIESGKLRAGDRVWTCDGWVQEWTTSADWKRPKESTNIHNRERVAKFGEDFKDVPLYALDRRRARDWANKNPGRVGAVRAMLNDARKEGLLENNPFEGLKTKRSAGRKHIKPMTEKEIDKLAQISYDKWEDWPVMGSMIKTAAWSGIRFGELLALRWSDIDWAKGTILIERQWSQKTRTYTLPKNGDARLVPMLGPVADALRLLDRSSPAGDTEVWSWPDNPHAAGDLVWYSPRGRRIEQALHDYYWRQVRERFLGSISEQRAIDIDLEWHALRHFTASILVDKNVAVHDVAYILGHTDGGRLVQELYGHLYPDNSISRIQRALAA